MTRQETPGEMVEPDALDRPIFVVGHPRSGTTLLASMLGRHPEIVSTPESLYLNMVRYDVGPALAKGAARVLDVIENSPMRFLVLDRQRLLSVLERRRLSEDTVFRAVLECFREADGKPRLLEKTPLHLRDMDTLFRWFPDARVLWILRDGRACVASLLKVDWAGNDPRALARHWVRNVSIGRMLHRRHPRGIHLLRYEDLVHDPQAVMGEVQAFIGVSPSAAVFDHQREVRTVKPTETGWKSNIARPLMAGRAEAWRDAFAPDTRAALNRVMGPLLRDYGYAVEAGPAGGIDGLRLAVATAGPSLQIQRWCRDRAARLRGHFRA